mgnify:CR=1 FL=1
MYFKNPVWYTSLNSYKVDFIPSYDFEYHELRHKNSEFSYPDHDNTRFYEIIKNITSDDEVHKCRKIYFRNKS